MVVYGYGIRWLAFKIHGFCVHAFFWGFRVVASLLLMARRTAVSQTLVPRGSRGISIIMKGTTT